MTQVTHFADEATLAHIARLERENAALREALDHVLHEWVNGRVVKDGITLTVRQMCDAALAGAPPSDRGGQPKPRWYTDELEEVLGLLADALKVPRYNADALLAAARQIGNTNRGAFVLTDDEWAEFVAYMENPGPPNPKWEETRRAMAEYRAAKASPARCTSVADGPTGTEIGG